MADLTIGSTASLDANSARHSVRISGLIAGEALPALSPVYVKSDGKVWNAVSTACTISNLPDFLGVNADAVAAGSAVTVFGKGNRFDTGATLTPGALFWISATTTGAISDTKVATADTPFAVAISTSDIVIIK